MGTGSWAHNSPKRDGDFRNGIPFGPIGNMLSYSGHFNPPSTMNAGLWLGVVTAELYYSAGWIAVTFANLTEMGYTAAISKYLLRHKSIQFHPKILRISENSSQTDFQNSGGLHQIFCESRYAEAAAEFRPHVLGRFGNTRLSAELTNNVTLRSRAWYDADTNDAFIVVVNGGGQRVNYSGKVRVGLGHS